MTSLVHLLVTCHVIQVVIATKTLYIGGLFNLGDKESWKVIPAAQIAVEEINNSSFLPGYRLELLVNDTRNGNFKLASDVQSYLDNGPKKIMLLGPVDNEEAKSVANYAALPQYRLLQFSYGTTDLGLAKKRHLYPYFFRTLISLATLDDLRISFIKHFSHWTEVGIIHGADLFSAELSHQLKSDLGTKGIKVLAEVRLEESDPSRAIRTIQEKDIHIIFGLFSVGKAARKMFCQAYKSGLYGPHYVWILQMAGNNGWWIPGTGEDIGGCKDIEMTCQIQNYFNVKPEHDFDTETDYSLSNKNTSHLVSEYNSRVDNGNNTSNRSTKAWLVYDAVWSIAHVLKNSQSKLSKPLENITYGDTQASIVFYNETLKLNFKSPNMKEVRYYSNGNRKFDMIIDQIIVKEENSNPVTQTAASYKVSSGKFEVKSINWRAGTPYRKTKNNYFTRSIHRALFGALIFLACLGLLYALICLIVVLVYRKQPVIWNSSPIMNTIIIVGCIFNYITVIMYAFDWTTTTRVTSLCRARAWTFAIGFTLSVGGLVAKLWIAYCVLSERFVRRWRNMLVCMLSIVLVLFILDVIIMGCWEGIDPLYAKMVVYKDQEMYKCFQPITAKTFQADWFTVEHCMCEYPVLWLLLVLILKFVVVFFGVFLAWQTRKLYIKSLNDTQHCGFCLFVVVFCAVLGVLCALLTTKLPNLFFGIVGTLLFLCTTIILALLYIHKMFRIVYKLKSRRGKTILVSSKDDPQSTKSSKSTSCSFCTCSAACCITMFSCFPCCNPYTCCRKCCCGTQVHPSKDDDKTEFYINGQAQEKEGQIAYLLRELHERDAELARLRPGLSTSMWTQTYEDDLDDEDDDDGVYSDRDDLDGDAGNSDGGSSTNSRRSRRGRKRNGVKIFNRGADYSHIRSKVDTGVAKSPRSQKKHDESYYLGVWQAKGGRANDAEIAKLRAQLKEKDKEIERLKKDKLNKNPNTKITIINEEADNPNTVEKQCQTDFTTPVSKKNSVTGVKSPSTSTKSTPSKTTSKNTKTSKNDFKDKVIIVKTKEEKEVKKEEEKPVQSNAEWLFGKHEEADATNTKEKEDKQDEEKTDVVDKSLDKQEQTKIIVIPAQNDGRNEAQHEGDKNEDDSRIDVVVVPTQLPTDEEKEKLEDRKKGEDNQKEKQMQEEEEERMKQLKLAEEKEKQEKQKQERRKSRFSFFGRKDSSSVESPKDIENQPINSDRQSEQEKPEIEKEKPVKPDTPKADKPDKPELPKVEKQDQPVQPESLVKKEQDDPVKKEKQDQPVQPESIVKKEQDDPVKLDSTENDKSGKEQEKPDLEKPDEQIKADNTKPSQAETKKPDEFDVEESHPIRPPQNTPASVGRPNDEATDDKKDETTEKQEQKADKVKNDSSASENEPSDEMDDIDEEGDDDEVDNRESSNDDDDDKDEEGEDSKDNQKTKRKKKRIGGKLNWNAESKVDTSNNYKRRQSKKIKTYKADYSHVKSKLTGSPSAKNNENKDENKEKEKRKPRRRVKKKRWNPNEKNQSETR